MITIKEILNSKKPKIYCDMDGVVADFEGQVKKIYGPDKKVEDVLPFRNLPGDWFLNLPKVKDADLLMRELKKYDVQMLTGMPGKKAMPYASDHKKQWMKKNYRLPADRVITVFTSDKPKYAVSNGISNVLIDDTLENIQKWELKGGIGILHKSATDTINKLNDILKQEVSENVEIKNGKVNGYFAIELDQKSQKLLKKHAIFPIVVSHHVTIAYKPNEYDAKNLERKLNDTFEISTKELMHNDNIQAISVEIKNLKRVDPGIAHVTISHTDKAKPVDSNVMMNNPNNSKKINIKLNGNLKFYKFK